MPDLLDNLEEKISSGTVQDLIKIANSTENHLVKSVISQASQIAESVISGSRDPRNVPISWSTSDSSMATLTSLLAASVRKRAEQKLHGKYMQQAITDASIDVTDSIITDGISLAMNDLDFDFDERDDEFRLHNRRSDLQLDNTARTSLPNIQAFQGNYSSTNDFTNNSDSMTSTNENGQQRHTVQPRCHTVESQLMQNNIFRARLHNNWKSNSDPCFVTGRVIEEKLKTQDDELRKMTSLDDQELIERVESATSSIIEEIQINLLESELFCEKSHNHIFST